jgi:catechol 2,3-dioxygenase-like lactoylglutathione lyase family enzyme
MMNALGHIRQLDYTVIYARDLPAMRHFYEKVMEFPVINVLSERWIEFGIGSTRLALTVQRQVQGPTAADRHPFAATRLSRAAGRGREVRGSSWRAGASR